MPRLERVQAAYQARILSNLRRALRNLLPQDDTGQVAGMVEVLGTFVAPTVFGGSSSINGMVYVAADWRTAQR